VAAELDFVTMSRMRFLTICLTLTAFASVIFPSLSYGEPATLESRKPKSNGAHVYLFRGILNVFSLGMDDLGEKLRKRGINNSVHSHLMWKILADDAIKEFKNGKIRSILIMGHSIGANAAVDMANWIGDAGVPVKLVVTLDPVLKSTVSNSNVRWVVNLYFPGGIGSVVAQPKGHRGVVDNVNLSNVPTDHMTLDKSSLIHERAIGYTLKAVRNDGAPPGTGRILDASARVKTGSHENAVQPQQ
jgi:hypothetical protein